MTAIAFFTCRLVLYTLGNGGERFVEELYYLSDLPPKVACGESLRAHMDQGQKLPRLRNHCHAGVDITPSPLLMQ